MPPLSLPAAFVAPVILAASLAASPSAALAQEAGAREASVRLVSLTGTGEVKARPDEAVVTVGVVRQGATAEEATRANSEAMGQVLAALEAEGIEDKDVQTTSFSVSPRYVYPKDGGGPPTIEGYEVSNQVSVRVRDLAKLGAVLDKVVTSGSNQINGIAFTVSEMDMLRNEARRLAVADARAKAELYAEAARVELGDVLSITEGGFTPPPRPMLGRAMAMDAKESMPVPIAEGEQTISIQVNISWEIK